MNLERVINLLEVGESYTFFLLEEKNCTNFGSSLSQKLVHFLEKESYTFWIGFYTPKTWLYIGCSLVIVNTISELQYLCIHTSILKD